MNESVPNRVQGAVDSNPTTPDYAKGVDPQVTSECALFDSYSSLEKIITSTLVHTASDLESIEKNTIIRVLWRSF